MINTGLLGTICLYCFGAWLVMLTLKIFLKTLLDLLERSANYLKMRAWYETWKPIISNHDVVFGRVVQDQKLQRDKFQPGDIIMVQAADVYLQPEE